MRVTLVSDSEVTVRCGNRVYARRANGCLWAAVEWFERSGYDLRWHHLPRNSDPWNGWLGEVAGMARSAAVGLARGMRDSPAGQPEPRKHWAHCGGGLP